MEPQIRYVKSADGTKIATATIGRGTPLVYIPGTIGHIEAHLHVPAYRTQTDLLAERFRFITYDPRGRGLSDRAVSDWSFGARLADLVAVFDGLSLAPAHVLTAAWGSTLGLALAAEHPQRIRRLALCPGITRGRDIGFTVAGRAVREVMEADWHLYCQFMALIGFGWTESARILADSLARAMTPETYGPMFRAVSHDDVSELVDRVACPVMLVNPTRDEPRQTLSPDVMRDLAAQLKDARVRSSSTVGLSFSVFEEDDLQAILRFFAEDEVSPQRGEPLLSGTTVVLFVDIADSTALTERLGDAPFRERARELDAELRDIIGEGGGTTIDAKTLGDGVLATFPSASQAIDAALRCGRAGARRVLPLRLGLHAGDVIREQNNVFGGTVNIASRISMLSAPGELLVSDVVRALARTSAGVTFEDRGEHVLKGVTEPQRVFAVRKVGA